MKKIGLELDSHYNVLFHVILQSISLTWKSSDNSHSIVEPIYTVASNFKRRYSPKYEENLDKGCVIIVYFSNKQKVHFEYNIET